MACQSKDSTINEVFELISSQGFDGLKEAVTMLINEAMQIERSKHLQADPYERSKARQGYANGFKPKCVKSRLGELELSVPQVRDSSFYPGALERGLRSERALTNAIAEMYVTGVATRKVKRITEELCGFEISSMDVSRAASTLDESLSAWRERPLSQYEYLFLDARYEKVRQGGNVLSSAVLIAYGIDKQGRRRILGTSVSLSEHEVHWRAFLNSLVTRGLHGIKLIISDAHAGLKAALTAVFPSVAWQRCQFHLQQNAQAYVPKQKMKREVAADIRAVFDAPNHEEALYLLNKLVKKYEKTAPDLAAWLPENVPQSLTVMQFPLAHRRRLRTSNIAERINKEIKRRTRVVGIFPNTQSCLRLVSAIIMEIDEEWIEGNTYLTFDN